MSSNKLKITLILLVIGAAAAACTLTAAGLNPTETPSMGATFVAQTIEAQMTEVARYATSTSDASAPTPTATLPLPTATQVPTNTPQPTATKTPVPTATSVPCNRAAFVSDITVPDGSLFTPGTEFSKVWRLRNVGSCAWTAKYELVFYSGDKMQGASTTKFNTRVEPGEYIDVGVNLTAPSSTGEYLGYWKLRTVEGTMFGIGANGNQPFWVEIEVIKPGTSFVYAFAENICDASWKDSSSPLPCQGAIGPEDNVVRLSDSFTMENGVTEDELGLWISLGKSSKVTGTYPAMVIQTGDRFIAEIGCIKDSKACDARFELKYKEVGSSTVNLIKSWEEDYDKSTTVINEDLSGLAGKNVKIILSVTSLTNSEVTEVFWFVPRLQNP